MLRSFQHVKRSARRNGSVFVLGMYTALSFLAPASCQYHSIDFTQRSETGFIYQAFSLATKK